MSRSGWLIAGTLCVTTVLWVAAQIAADVARNDYAVMLCGSMAFVTDFARQFRDLGLPRDRIITEEPQFRSQ